MLLAKGRDVVLLNLLKVRCHHLIWLMLAFGVFVLDQLSKWIACQFLTLYQTVPVLPFFSLSLVHNNGAAFSFLSAANGWQRWFFIGLAVCIGIGILFWLCRLSAKQVWMACGLSLILGGAMGNLWDRVCLGYVIDFLLLHWADFRWPVFNLADTAICIGAGILFFHWFKQP
jgi:signal peptidase II